MTDLTVALLLTYGAGVLVGVFAFDDTLPKRIGLAALWPLGPLTFVVVIAVLLLTLPIAFPRLAAVLVVLLAASWIIYQAVV